jgi:hypothetical protein
MAIRLTMRSNSGGSCAVCVNRIQNLSKKFILLFWVRAYFLICIHDLGLGDTNYSNFGAHPKKIVKKMLEMGGTVFYPIRIADEVEGFVTTANV